MTEVIQIILICVLGSKKISTPMQKFKLYTLPHPLRRTQPFVFVQVAHMQASMLLLPCYETLLQSLVNE